MAFTSNDDNRHRFNKELYDALMEGNEGVVIQKCNPLHALTIHNDTVLHMATYSRKIDLAIKLLNALPVDHRNGLTIVNDVGNTILHEAAATREALPAAEKMLEMAPELLTMRNARGETALFRAAHYGNTEIFKFLTMELDKKPEDKANFQRGDKTTVLHIAVLAEHFGLALWIAKKYNYLIGERDGDGMTALQLLTFNSSAFKSGSKKGLFRELIYSWVSIEDMITREDGEGLTMKAYKPFSHIVHRVKSCLFKDVRKKKQQHHSAFELAKFLIEKDTSWEKTKPATDPGKPITHEYSEIGNNHDTELGGRHSTATPSTVETVEEILQKYSVAVEHEDDKREKILHIAIKHRKRSAKTSKTPLFLATKSGIVEIVEEILKLYPQAVEHINDKGHNILHIAIKHRRKEIFELVERMKIPMNRLTRKIDNNGNSILHMVGTKRSHSMDEKMPSPALLLQEELIFFEQVKKVSKTYFVKHYNFENQTAEELFAINNEQLRRDAQEWLKRTSENCSIVAVLIATVAFAAAYTVPGGPNQSTGYPILLNQPFFEIFILTDVLSLTFALTSVVKFLSILTSSYRLKDFKRSLPRKLILGLTYLLISVSMMMSSFAATIILLIHNRESWTKIALSSVALPSVTVFMFSYLPLFHLLMKNFMPSLKSIRKACRRLNCVLPSVSGPKSQTKMPPQSQTTFPRTYSPEATRFPV